MKINHWIALAVFLIVVLLVLFRNKTEPVKKGPLVSTSFYPFEITSLDGERKTLADFQGSILIVDVWDTWCPPCKKGIPDFIELYSEYKNKGLAILGVALGREGEATVRTFIREYGINYMNTLATKEFLDGIGTVQGIPTTFVIDQNGQVFHTYVGYRPKSDFQRDIEHLLNSK